jgi:hypothetical protein
MMRSALFYDIEDAKSFTADKLEVNVGINISLKIYM